MTNIMLKWCKKATCSIHFPSFSQIVWQIAVSFRFAFSFAAWRLEAVKLKHDANEPTFPHLQLHFVPTTEDETAGNHWKFDSLTSKFIELP